MPPGQNNPPALKGRKKRSSGWFITIVSNKTFDGIGGEDGVQRFKHAIMELFSRPENMAEIIKFRVYGAPTEEHTMNKLEAVKQYIQWPIAMEGVLERSGKNSTPLIHAHIITGMFHWSSIHLDSAKARDWFHTKLGYPVKFQLGGDSGNLRSYQQMPTPDEVAIAMAYAGKDIRMDGDYFTGTHEYTVAEYDMKYGKGEPTEEDFNVEI